MKHDEETAAILWETATGDMIARTRKQPKQESSGKPPVIFRDPKLVKFAVNE
jgi:hypothetical protein